MKTFKFNLLDRKKIEKVLKSKEAKEKLLNNIEVALSDCEKYKAACDYVKGCYFWTPPFKADARREAEEDNSFSAENENDVFTYFLGLRMKYTCSNVYAYKDVTIGEKEGDGKTVNTFIRELTALKQVLNGELGVRITKEELADDVTEEALNDSKNDFIRVANSIREIKEDYIEDFLEDVKEDVIEKLLNMGTKKAINYDNAFNLLNDFNSIRDLVDNCSNYYFVSSNIAA